MKVCPEHQQELAACAALCGEPKANLSAHLEHCADCRAAFNELREIAALQVRMAGRLPEPAASAALPLKFAKFVGRGQRPDRFTWVRPLVALSGTAVVALILSLVVRREAHRTNPSVVLAPPSAVYASSGAESPDPTWQAFRHNLQLDNLANPRVRLFGAVEGQYRLKDAYTEQD
jgi:hypothetical protein